MKKWFLICGVTLSGLLLFSLGSALALEIFYPADGTYITRSNFVVIKAGKTPAIDGMIVELNGGRTDLIDVSSPEYRAAFDDFLILQPEFEPGENSIKVEGFAGGSKVSEAAVKVYYLKELTEVPPSNYQPFVMHTAKNEQLCASCHNMQPDKVELQTVAAGQNPCASCHKRMLNRKHVHGPAGVYRCTYCHQSDSKPQRYEVRKDGDAELCNECHAEQSKAFKANTYVHGPVGAGMCSVCHDSHATDNPAQLLAPINEICLGCHEAVAEQPHVARGISGQTHPLTGVPDPSNAGQELSCASCHNPHGGMNPFLFQRGITNRFGLCGLCHKK